MTQTIWNAVVLGSGDAGDPLAAAHGVSVKPLISLGGQPMAAYVLQALQGSGVVAQVAYVGPTTPMLDRWIDQRVTDRGSLLGNLEAGLAALPTPQETKIVVVTADIPLLSAQEVRDILAAAPADAGVVYPIVRREDCEAAYPGIKRTYARLSDGTFTGGNLFIVDSKVVTQFLPRLREVLAARKSPLKLASIVGLSTAVRLVLGHLSIAELEQKVSQILQVKARALISPYPAVGTDIDKESDLELAKRMLNHKPE